MKSIKAELIQEIKHILNVRLTELNGDIESLRESLNTEDKSSAGDKHETSRAMMQIELEKLENQYALNHKILDQCSSLHPEYKYDHASIGSLVETDKATFFIAAGLGKLSVKGNMYFAISLVSPIGLAMKGKKAGDSFEVNGTTHKIKSIH